MKPRTLTWVLGRGGLLGSHLVRALASHLAYADSWQPAGGPFCWTEPEVLFDQLARAATGFAAAAQAGYEHWLIVWAAGAGVVSTPSLALDAEVRTWQRLLELLEERLLAPPAPLPGTVFLASSAGGVFGRGADRPLTEAAPVAPVSAYGRCKLQQEEWLLAWAGRHPGVRYLIGRIANLYGPGQNLHKPQGLISHLCRCLLFQRPAHVYVPLDTIRDYVFVEDGAEQIARCLDRVVAGEPCRVQKLIASEAPASVAQLIGLLARLCPTHPRIICSYSAQRLRQPRKLLFRSVVWPDLRPRQPTTLALGLGRVYQHQRALFGRGRLPPPRG